MLSRGPNPNSGDSRAATWLRRLLAAVQANKLLPGIGYKLKHSTLGTTLEINPGKGGVGGTSTGAQMCLITELFEEDYFGVKLFNGVTTSGDQFNIAKSVPSRMATGQTIEGTTFSYTYDDDNHRTSNDGATDEAQVMRPQFVVQNLVFAIAADHTYVTVDETELLFIELNTEREWCKKYL